jgi:hypothetical protein
LPTASSLDCGRTRLALNRRCAGAGRPNRKILRFARFTLAGGIGGSFAGELSSRTRAVKADGLRRHPRGRGNRHSGALHGLPPSPDRGPGKAWRSTAAAVGGPRSSTGRRRSSSAIDPPCLQKLRGVGRSPTARRRESSRRGFRVSWNGTPYGSVRAKRKPMTPAPEPGGFSSRSAERQ